MGPHMQKLSEQLKRPSLDSLFCRVSKGDFLPFINPLEANAVRKVCGKLGIEIVSCKDSNLKDYLKEIDGLDLLSIKDRNPFRLQLPQYIPVIGREFFNYNADIIEYDTIGVSLKDIFISPPKKYIGRLHVGNLKIKKGLLSSPIFRNKKVVLFSSGPDTLIEKVWREREELNLFSELAKIGFTLVTGMNFSIFSGECPVGHAINFKKSLKYFALLQKFSIPAIPHISWVHELHLQRWVEWLKVNPSINLIAINCQMSKSSDDCQIIWEGIQYLIQHTKHELHFLLEGPRKKLLIELIKHSPFIHIAVKEPSMVSMYHKKYILNQNKLKRIDEKNASKDELLRSNIGTYHSYLQEILFRRQTPHKRAFKNKLKDRFSLSVVK